MTPYPKGPGLHSSRAPSGCRLAVVAAVAVVAVAAVVPAVAVVALVAVVAAAAAAAAAATHIYLLLLLVVLLARIKWYGCQCISACWCWGDRAAHLRPGNAGGPAGS